MKLQVDPSAAGRVRRVDAAKANRLRIVSGDALPDGGEEGDFVWQIPQTAERPPALHVRIDGAWTNIDDVLNQRVNGLEQRIAALEPEDD